MKNNIPRTPTEKELQELIEYWMYEEGYGMEMVEEEAVKKWFTAWLDKAAIVVFDHYEEMNYPSYKGKVLVVITSVDVALHETYIWKNGKIMRINEGEAL